jgi:hypothetical protein
MKGGFYMKESDERRYAMICRIKAICPDSDRRIYVTDDWYPSYTDAQTGKLYVECYVLCTYYDGEFGAIIAFWGGDDFYLGKRFDSSDINEVIKAYRRFKKYAKKVPHGRNLQHILYRDGFSYDF